MAVRVVGGVLTAVLGIPLVVLMAMVLSARFGPPAQDPHGYVLIFGALFAIPLAFATAVVAPLILPRGRRALGYAISAGVFAVVTVVLLASWFTA